MLCGNDKTKRICPKTRRCVEPGRERRWASWTLPFVGLVSLLWFLVRVIPKPSRATYPCQRVAFPIASGFVVWLTGIVVSSLAYRKAKHLAGRARYLTAGLFAVAAVGAIWWSLSITADTSTLAAFVPSDPPNSPIGIGKGIFPGRVVWIHDPNATTWNGVTGFWWDDTNTNQAVVDNMVSTAIQGLTGESSDADAWDALFRHFNQTHGFGDVGYQPGEKIAIKINLNEEGYGPAYSGNGRMPSPQMIHSLLAQLFDKVHVSGSNVTIYDASRAIADPLYNRIHGDADPNFQNVRFVANTTGNGRIGAVYDPASPVHFANPSVSPPNNATAYPPTCVTEAKYLIDMALLSGHSMYGVTACGKNWFGSVCWRTNASYWPWNGGWTPSPLHNFGLRNNPMGSYNCIVDLMGHPQLGGKTLLFLVDGLYGSDNAITTVIRYSSFGNNWTASVFASQDPVAIDSVVVDFLRNEPLLNDYCTGQGVDNYLHEAAQADNPPSGSFYDPASTGHRLASLGVHEHWNNSTARQYSRNLGTGNGIELVTHNQMWTSADGPIRNLTRERRYDYVQYAINDARHGDEIVVPQAVYPENINLKGKNVTIRSAEPNNPSCVAATIIRGSGSGPVVTLQGGEEPNCVLAGLTITGGEVGVYCSAASPTIAGCVITANTSFGMRLWDISQPAIIDSLIVTNGGGIELSQGRGITSSVTITNCTIVGNSGYGVYSGVQTITNSIIYYNDPNQVFGTTSTVTFSDVQGGWPGEGNIAVDPCFADPCNCDYHLKSQAGRWSPAGQAWVLDGVTSRCIDAGDPASDWTAELWPHGKRTNMGRYGGTLEASMSLSGAGSAADLNLDDCVDFRDFDDLADNWRKEQNFLPEDIDRNGHVDGFDIGAFVDQWLWIEP